MSALKSFSHGFDHRDPAYLQLMYREDKYKSKDGMAKRVPN